MKYDLEERTVKFAEQVIDFVKTIKEDAVNRRIISQLVGAAGSFGANYCEATEAESRKDFIHKIGICKKEKKEVEHCLRLLARSNPEHKEKIRDYGMVIAQLDAIVFTTFNRAWRGEERGSLRRHMNVSELIGARPTPTQQDKGGVFS